MKLDGYFGYCFALALVCKPGMIKIRADKRQFQFVNHLNMAANYTFGPFCIQYQVKFILFVIMKREVKFFFNPRKNVKQSLGVSGVISRITLLVINILVGIKVVKIVIRI